jgi:hypothetical protein
MIRPICHYTTRCLAGPPASMRDGEWRGIPRAATPRPAAPGCTPQAALPRAHSSCNRNHWSSCPGLSLHGMTTAPIASPTDQKPTAENRNVQQHAPNNLKHALPRAPPLPLVQPHVLRSHHRQRPDQNRVEPAAHSRWR